MWCSPTDEAPTEGLNAVTPKMVCLDPKPKPKPDADPGFDSNVGADPNATVTAKMVDKAEAIDLDLNGDPAPRVCDNYYSIIY